MISVVYNYHCACGYHYVAQEKVQAGSYIRLLIDTVLLCPECKQSLQPKVLVAYASLPTNESVSRDAQADEREE
jgi:hypothetical protein